MILISKDGTQKRRCRGCGTLKSDVYCINPEQHKVRRCYVCASCHDESISIALNNYREQLRSGASKAQTYVLIRWDIFTGRMRAEICAGIIVADAEWAARARTA